MVRIEGLVTKKVIRAWLDSWDSIISDDRPIDAVPCNSGSKNMDGISNTKLNRIMLEATIAELPPVLKVCLTYRWLEQRPLGTCSLRE